MLQKKIPFKPLRQETAISGCFLFFFNLFLMFLLISWMFRRQRFIMASVLATVGFIFHRKACQPSQYFANHHSILLRSPVFLKELFLK